MRLLWHVIISPTISAKSTVHSRVSGDGCGSRDAAVERRGFGCPRGILRTAKGGKSVGLHTIETYRLPPPPPSVLAHLRGYHRFPIYRSNRDLREVAPIVFAFIGCALVYRY